MTIWNIEYRISNVVQRDIKKHNRIRYSKYDIRIYLKYSVGKKLF